MTDVEDDHANRFANDPYTWDGLTGWKSFRTLRPFRGMYWDVRRRLPYYWSDWVDGLNYRTFAGTIRIFFVNLLPALAFELDMMRRTGNYFGINEALFSSALAAFVFSLFSCQPLTVVGITGLISLFNYTIYDIGADQGIRDLYPQFIAWVSIWAAITHWMASIFNWCDYMRYITDFSSNSFGTYVSIIYMIKGVEELVALFDETNAEAGYLGIVIAISFWATVWFLESMGSTIYVRPFVRKLLSDYAYPIATIFWTGFSHIPGRIKNAGLSRIPHTRAFYPSQDRGWLVDFWNLPVKWVFVALPLGILLTLLFYYDHNVSSLTAQAKQFPLKKPAGFHWDFFLLGCTSFIAGIIGLPLPNGLVPQAPVHTDSLVEYRDYLTKTKEKTDDDTADSSQWVSHNYKKVEAVMVREQRVSHFLMMLALVGCMTGPLLIVLHTMPRALFAGVFFVVGWSGIPGFNITQNLLYCMSEKRFTEPGDPRNTLKKSRILYFTFWQVLGIAISVAISQTIAAIGFPVVIVSLIPLRWILLPRIFTEHELMVLDAPTADSDVVLCSMGGQPERPEVVMAKKKRGERNASGEEAAAYSSGSSETGQVMRERKSTKDGEQLAEQEREKKREAEGFKTTLNTGHN
ncbi:related to human band 3 anion transport [Lecanosticta acicola]|uniref:Related to human band 3 anion transport n=1 Tax=Lecanosticta acicola TaxID=111012 RepID=A0AAI8Z2K9_9PEZI|nr:related to human band 3 anion transport [Lecanosticta acicola]